MRINTRFSAAVHILSLIALSESPVTSEMAALSAGSHPVAVRQVMSMLRKAGLVETRSGLPGGKLCKAPEEITLREIYRAVNNSGKLFDLHPKPNPLCPVGRNIKAALEAPLADAQEALEERLSEYTLNDITSYIIEKHNENGGRLYEGI